MIFPTPLLKGTLIKRYKRFLADIELEGSSSPLTIHCPNSGAMQGLSTPGTPLWVSPSSNPSRKLPYTWQMVEVEGVFVGINTANPNTLVKEAIQSGVIQELQGYQTLRREVSYGQNSRVDIVLENSSQPFTYVEVKNVHLKREKTAAFPSSVTIRGAKHMRELSAVVNNGHKAYVIYVVQRKDCETFELAEDIDPAYAKESQKAFKCGVIPLVYACEVTPKAITITHPLKFSF